MNNLKRVLNQADVARLKKADEEVPAQKLALALLLLDADGRLEQYEGSPWLDLPPMIRWMSHALLHNDELRVHVIKILKMGDKWPMTN